MGGGSPPQIPTFGGSNPKHLERGPQYSTRRRKFQKIQRTFVVLPWVHNPRTFRDVLHQPLRCPTKKTKKVLILPVLAPFSTRWLGHREFSRETLRKLLILQSRCRTENVHWAFENFAYGLRYMGRFCEPFEAQSEKSVRF